MSSNRSLVGRIIPFALAFVGCFIVFSMLIVAASLVPRSEIWANVSESADVLSREGTYPCIVGGDDARWQLDNYTNAVMLNIAVTETGNPIEDAFGGYMKNASGDPVVSLGMVMSRDADDVSPTAYARYWHGWLALVRPLLLFLNLQQIRMVFFVVMTAAICLVALLVARARGSLVSGIGLVAVMAGFSYPVVCFSLSLWFSFMVALMLMVFVSLDRVQGGRLLRVSTDSFGRLPLVMFCTGAVTVYLDFLCTPLVSLGLPLALLLYLNSEETWMGSPKRVLLLVVSCALAWGMGYALLWVTKWAVSSLVLGWDVVGDAVRQSFSRAGSQRVSASGDVVSFSRLGALWANVRLMLPGWVVALMGVGAMALLVVVVLRRRQLARVRWSVILGLMLVALLPYAWYLMTANHSLVHSFFTWRAQAVTAFAVLLGIIELLRSVGLSYVSGARSE